MYCIYVDITYKFMYNFITLAAIIFDNHLIAIQNRNGRFYF